MFALLRDPYLLFATYRRNGKVLLDYSPNRGRTLDGCWSLLQSHIAYFKPDKVEYRIIAVDLTCIHSSDDEPQPLPPATKELPLWAKPYTHTEGEPHEA